MTTSSDHEQVRVTSRRVSVTVPCLTLETLRTALARLEHYSGPDAPIAIQNHPSASTTITAIRQEDDR